MKNKLYISLFAASIVAFSSCETKVNNFMVDDTVALVNPGLVVENVYTGLDDPSTVYVLKSGKGFQGAKVTISVDETVLTEYNETAKVSLSALPADCYQLTVSSLELTPDDYMSPFLISWNRDKLATALAADENMAIPLRLSVEGNDVNINLERLTTLIKPVLDTPNISLESSGLVTGLMPTRRSASEEDVYMNIVSNFIAQQDIEVKLDIDPTLVDQYNEANGTSFKLLPAEAYRLDKDWTIKKSATKARFKFTFVREALIPEDGGSKFGSYILPIRIASVSTSNINAENAYMLYNVSVVAAEIDKAKWTIIDCSNTIADDPDENTAKGDYKPEYLIDGNTSTSWRSVWSVENELPYSFTIDFGQDRDLYKVGFDVPAGSNRKYGNSKSGYVEASLDGKNWTKICDWTSAVNNRAPDPFEVTPTTARYIRFYVTEVFSKPNHNSISEISVWGE